MADEWEAIVENETATWTGGPLAANTGTTFEVELAVDDTTPAGPVQLQAEQRYPGGGSLPWPIPVTVIPASDESSQRVTWAIAGGLALVATAGIGLFAAPAPQPHTSREIAEASASVVPAVIFTQFVDEALGCASYLVADESTHQAVVVDPAFAIEQYLEEAERRGVRLVRVLETHTHADHLSGHGRLALEHELPVSIHSAAEADYAHDALEDGAEISLGDVVLRCIHTPGHRPEHCCFDRRRRLTCARAVARPDGRLVVRRRCRTS